MSEMGMVMDEDVQNAFDKLDDKLDDFIQADHERWLAQAIRCGQEEKAAGVLKQRFDNGEKQEAKDIKKKSNKIAYDRWIVSIVVLGIAIWTIIKDLVL